MVLIPRLRRILLLLQTFPEVGVGWEVGLMWVRMVKIWHARRIVRHGVGLGQGQGCWHSSLSLVVVACLCDALVGVKE